ncbi:MAG: HAD-IC family P-type ATPase, partial [Planctomycetes bacterium]|nr:HAD-IC family P-type ATPase [Planctomycetota bacterium]
MEIQVEDGSGCPCCGEDSPPHACEERREIRVLAISGVLFVCALLFEEGLENRLGIHFAWLAYAIPYLVCGSSIIRTAGRALLRGDVFNEFTLMTLATLAAIAIAELPEAVGIMLFYRCGEFLQERAAGNSRRSISRLMASKPNQAHVLQDGQTVDRPVESVLPGQRIAVRAGEKIPLDGVVLTGVSTVDQSPLTGESIPVNVQEGDQVLGGAINLASVLTVEVSRPFAQSHIARILELTEHASANKSPTERFITRFARYYTPAVVVAALLAAAVPPLFLGGDWRDWVYRALVLLVIACPCALLISIPLGYFGGIGAASRRGILVKGGAVFDNLQQVNSVVFDKTGTLTQAACKVSRLAAAPGVSEEELLRAAYIAESCSNHPLARAIVQYYLDNASPGFPAPSGAPDRNPANSPSELAMQEL